MDTLNKSFDLLEFVLLQNGRPVTPTEAARYTGLPLSTATRILSALAGRGYLDKVSRKSGYAPGAMVASLANRDNVYHRLALAAAEPIRILAARTLCAVNMAVLRGMERIMLVYMGPSPYWKPWERLQFSDHASTATGRLLLSTLSEEELLGMYKKLNLNNWPEVKSPESLLAECSKLKSQGFIRFIGYQQRVIMGHLIRVPGYPAAALGFGTPDHSRADEYFQESAEAAKRIEEFLQRTFSVFLE